MKGSPMKTNRAKQAAAVWAVLRRNRGRWLPTWDLTEQANTYRLVRWPNIREWGSAAITARLRDFRKPEYGGHVIKHEKRPGQGDSYRLIR